MYRKNNTRKSSFDVNGSVEGEYLFQSLKRKLDNSEKISSEVTLIYTDKKDGVLAGYNIRTDKWEIALDGIDKIQRSREARGDANLNKAENNEEENDNNENDLSNKSEKGDLSQ